MKNIIGVFVLLSGVFMGTAKAESLACMSLPVDTTLQIQLRKDASFKNCFNLDAIPVNSKINVISASKDGVAHNIRISEILPSAVLQQLSSYSAANGGTAFQIAPTTKRLTLTIQPTSKLTSDKDLQISYGFVQGEAVILINLYQVVGTTRTPPSCVPGTICTNPQSDPPPNSSSGSTPSTQTEKKNLL